jgi:hypothetical protein
MLALSAGLVPRSLSAAHLVEGIKAYSLQLLARDVAVLFLDRCCQGRVVSALEGGYRIQGGIVSAFARSVAAHVRALSESHDQRWDPAEAQVPPTSARHREGNLVGRKRSSLVLAKASDLPNTCNAKVPCSDAPLSCITRGAVASCLHSQSVAAHARGSAHATQVMSTSRKALLLS